MRTGSKRQTRVGDVPADVKRLCVMTGAHRGASCTLAAGAMAVIGQRDDCDIILSDDGVAPHHCIVSNIGNVPMVRAVDGNVTVDGNTVEPGDPRPLSDFDALAINDSVTVLVGDADDERWDELLRTVAVRSLDRPPAPRRWPVATAAMFAIAASVTTAAMMLRDDALVLLPAQLPEVKRVVNDMQLPEVRVRKGAEQIEVIGVVRAEATREKLKDTLADMGTGLDVRVRTGEEIASDVREILRMSGLGARTRYAGNGEVTVSGVFEDEARLQNALESRAVMDVAGLVKVSVLNSGTPVKVLAEEDQIPPEKKIVAVVRGDDPYLVTADSSRYYIGARLPDGSILHDIIADDIWVLTEDGIKRLNPEYSHVSRVSMDATGDKAPRSQE